MGLPPLHDREGAASVAAPLPVSFSGGMHVRCLCRLVQPCGRIDVRSLSPWDALGARPSKTAADCPCLVFPYIERTGQGLRPAVGGLFSFRQYDAGTGLCCPLAAAFSLSAKDTFQRPPATRWTGIFQNFFCLSNPGNRILATGGAENFSFHSPHHRS